MLWPGRYVQSVVKRFASFRHEFPDRDTNAWLAATCHAYKPMFHPREDSFWFVETAAYSVLHGANPQIALGCQLAIAIAGADADGRIAESYSYLEQELSSVSSLARCGRFADIWRAKNRWTERNAPEVVAAISEPDFWSDVERQFEEDSISGEGTA